MRDVITEEFKFFIFENMKKEVAEGLSYHLELKCDSLTTVHTKMNNDGYFYVELPIGAEKFCEKWIEHFSDKFGVKPYIEKTSETFYKRKGGPGKITNEFIRLNFRIEDFFQHVDIVPSNETFFEELEYYIAKHDYQRDKVSDMKEVLYLVGLTDDDWIHIDTTLVEEFEKFFKECYKDHNYVSGLNPFAEY